MTLFAGRLRELRSQRGLTQSELANRIGVNKQTISQYERGVREPNFETLDALCDYFNVSSDYILGKEDVTMRYVDAKGLEMLDSDELAPYYIDPDARDLANFLKDNPEHKVLFDASRKVKKEDISRALKAVGIFIDE